MKLSVCFLVLNIALSVAGEAPKTWNEWLAEGTRLVGGGNYQSAASAFRQALTLAESSGISDRQLVRIIGSLASAYADAGQYLESEHEWRRALALAEKTEGPESLDYALLVASIAVLPTCENWAASTRPNRWLCAHGRLNWPPIGETE